MIDTVLLMFFVESSKRSKTTSDYTCLVSIDLIGKRGSTVTHLNDIDRLK